MSGIALAKQENCPFLGAHRGGRPYNVSNQNFTAFLFSRTEFRLVVIFVKIAK